MSCAGCRHASRRAQTGAKGLGLPYGFLTTYRHTFFIKRLARKHYAITNAFLPTSTNPSVPEMLFCESVTMGDSVDLEDLWNLSDLRELGDPGDLGGLADLRDLEDLGDWGVRRRPAPIWAELRVRPTPANSNLSSHTHMSHSHSTPCHTHAHARSGWAGTGHCAAGFRWRRVIRARARR